MDVKEQRNLFEPTATKPPSQFTRAWDRSRGPFGRMSINEVGFFRDGFHLSTWLLLGACLQGIIFAITRSLYSLAPAFIIISLRIGDTLLQTFGLKVNPHMAGTIDRYFSTQFPNEEGKYSGAISNEDIVLIMLGARCNHPMGVFGPGFRETGVFFENNVKHLEANAEEYGFLGMSQWINLGDRSTNSELLMIGYFRTVEGLHKWANSGEHRKGWDWWVKGRKTWKHIQLMHELYRVPKGNWESTFMNCAPTGLAMTSMARTVKLRTEKGEEELKRWYSPVIDADKGSMRSSMVRMTS